MASPCKRHPHFLAREFQAPMGAYSGDYGSELKSWKKEEDLWEVVVWKPVHYEVTLHNYTNKTAQCR